MIIHGQFYDGIVGKPDLDDALEHYGVLGMKWGVRKDPEKAFSKAAKKYGKYQKKIDKANKKYIKEAGKVSRFFGRKRAQKKVVRLNAKKDYLNAKQNKWDRKVSDIYRKEYDRLLNKVTDDNERRSKISNLEKAKYKYSDKVLDIYAKSKGASKATLADVINADFKAKTHNSKELHIENKVKNARKTGKYDMEFLEKGLDIHPKTGEALEGKALDDAYRKYLKNKK